MTNRKRGAFILTCILVVFIAFVLPGFSRPDAPLCGVQRASAQDDPCLDREVTISAQQVQILQLQGTINAQAIANLQLAGTDTALRATLDAAQQLPANRVVITVPVIITATQNPSVTQAVRVMTATPDIFPETLAALPPNCALHTVEEGEFVSLIAEQYGVDLEALLSVNQLDEASAAFLQIGDVLIIPLPGCSLAAANAQATPTPFATAALPPTATNAQVEIVRVLSPGDISAEGVDIRNNGAVVDLTGWQLSDGSGSTYTMPEQRLFTGSVITIYTRVGTDTPTAKFWGRDSAVWASGDSVIFSDEHGVVQSVYRVP